jgi:hypothetical protein
MRLGGSQRRSGHIGEEKNSQSLPELEPPTIQRYTTEISRLQEVLGSTFNPETGYIEYIFVILSVTPVKYLATRPDQFWGPPRLFMGWYLVKYRDNFTFTYTSQIFG